MTPLILTALFAEPVGEMLFVLCAKALDSVELSDTLIITLLTISRRHRHQCI